MSRQPIGILGGTFDPVHVGHIQLATKLYNLCDFQKILLIPCYQSPLKIQATTSTVDRLNMLRLAITNIAYLEIDISEIQAPTISYTIDTLKILRQKYVATPLALIMGYDLFCNFTAWYKWQEILTLAHLVAVERPTYPLQNLPSPLTTLLQTRQITNPQALHMHAAGLIYRSTLNLPDVSSTLIRSLIQQNQNTDKFLPQAIQNYIQQHKLYIAQHNK